MSTIKVGQAIPHFSLPGMDGKRYESRAALARGPLLLTFFKVSCPTCQYTSPFLERLYQQFKPNGIQVWSVAQDNAQESERYAREYAVTFPILIDDYPYAESRAYGVKYVPTLFLIGQTGKVELTTDGFAKADLRAIHKWFGKHFSVNPPPLFLAQERVPDFKPG